MATFHDLFELASVAANTTYSKVAGTLLGVVDNVTSSALDDGEYDVGDAITIGGIPYTINLIQEPSGNGFFTLSNGGTTPFSAGSESNLQVVFLTVSNGGTTRYFAVPNDSFGDFRIQSLTTGTLTTVAGSDAAVISTVNNATGVDCFAAGTLIATPSVQVKIEDINIGDLVLTRDHGPQPVRLRLMRDLDFAFAPQRLRPIAFEAGSLGRGRPSARLCVSPQHRILVTPPLGQPVLVPARALIGHRGVRIMQGLRRVRYFHVVFSQHELIFANDTPTESFYPGKVALERVSSRTMGEIVDIFGQYAVNTAAIKTAAPVLRTRAARVLALARA